MFLGPDQNVNQMITKLNEVFKMSSQEQSSWVVLKFGGTSVLDASCWGRILTIIDQRQSDGLRPWIVLSAPRGVSDYLTSLCTCQMHEHLSIIADIEVIFARLAKSLKVDFDDLLKSFMGELKDLCDKMQHDQHPKYHASIMAYGEWVISHLAHRFFLDQGINAHFLDVKKVLMAKKHDAYGYQHYLNAYCDCDPNPSILQEFSSDNSLVVTQGFTASNHLGETVVLGRGGSDTSAAYLAVIIQARHVEIWTDVAGVYTANPKLIPEARLLPSLDYEEAQEMALMGGKVLHPRTLAPLQQAKIPLWVRSSYELHLKGTLIAEQSGYQDSQIKSIISKKGVMLIQMTALAMWRQAGFLAQIFDCFKRHAISVDLISTSEMNVTISLDLTRNELQRSVIDALLKDLNEFCLAELIGPCGAISLIGRRMRSMLYKLSGCLALLSEQKVYLISQASNDLNFSFIVDEKHIDRLLQKLHHILLEDSSAKEYVSDVTTVKQTAFYAADDWWVEHRDVLLKKLSDDLPMYVYDAQTLKEKAQKMLACHAIDQSFYAVKANANRQVLKIFEKQGLGFECVSIQEVRFLFQVFPDLLPDRVIFTPNFVGKQEYQEAISLGVWVILDSLYPLEMWPKVFEDQQVLLRVDPGVGHGHHRYVTTGGKDSKFGISVEALKDFAHHIQKHRVKVIGLHVHTGSGVLDVHHWEDNARFLLQLLPLFPEVRILNLGGGLGVAQKPGEPQLDVERINDDLLTIKRAYPQLKFWWEPGRYLVAQAGILLTRVNQVKNKSGRAFVGLDTGMNSLIRPALYGAYHHVINLTRLDEPCAIRAHLVGPICESSDCFGYERLIPHTQAGDVMLVSHVGAYGHSMSSHYNMREPASEWLFDKSEVFDLSH